MPNHAMPARQTEGSSVPACPKCKQTFVRRVLPKKGLEHLLWHLFLYPFRCQLCTHRFLALRFGQRYTIQLDDMREYERLRIKLPATFTAGSVRGSGATVDITMKGCWIDCPQRVMVSKGMTLSLKLQEPGKNLSIDVESAMVRWALGRGIGIEFLSIKPNQLDRLRALVLSTWNKLRSEEPEAEGRTTQVIPLKKKLRASART
jgi:hypothetical protein